MLSCLRKDTTPSTRGFFDYQHIKSRVCIASCTNLNAERKGTFRHAYITSGKIKLLVFLIMHMTQLRLTSMLGVAGYVVRNFLRKCTWVGAQMWIGAVKWFERRLIKKKLNHIRLLECACKRIWLPFRDSHSHSTKKICNVRWQT